MEQGVLPGMEDKHPPSRVGQLHLQCSHGASIETFGEALLEVKVGLKEALEKMDKRDERMALALEGLADQGARINSIRETSDRHNHDLEEAFTRLRSIEMVIGKDGDSLGLVIQTTVDTKFSKMIRLIELLTSKPAVFVAVSLAVLTVLGTCFDIWYHFEGVKAVWAAYKSIK